MPLSRRHFSALSLASLSPLAGAAGQPEHRQNRSPDPLPAALAALERRSGGRLGVWIEDSATGRVLAQRADDRFAMCSTFKWLVCAQLLQSVDRGEARLDQVLPFGKADLVAWSPVTERHAQGAGLSLAALCQATLTTSDNTAGNLLLARLGGPAAFTAALRAQGDAVTRLDRVEPDLNRFPPGEERDSSSPRAMAAQLRRFLLGDGLAPGSRQQLTDWMQASTTGARRLRAGLPAGWRLATKTGTADGDAPRDNHTNEVGVLWPPGRAPLVVVAFLAGSSQPFAQREAVLARVAAQLPRFIAA
ncbi:beta-lactamase class A [Burkholderiales bacterium JOSHI_001]|nr:beta-lactamase class A [Burkholderiales bacterium JOSHI_001]